MRFPEYDRHDALGLAALVRKGEVSPLELVEAAIERIERRNGPLNAVIHKGYDRARAAAQQPLPDGPFRGVPYLFKDLLSADAGQPFESGSRMYRGHRAAHSSTMVERVRAAGLVVVGRTNTPELGLVPVTEPESAGATHNPWDLALTPGGSSGGSAAAVAARMVPMAGGGDGGGSLRIPASCCGVFGLKPSRGRNPTGPSDGELWEGFAQEHALTRSVRDSAALLDATQGSDPGAPYAAPPRARPFLEEVGAAPGKLRIALTLDPPLGQELHPDCRAAALDAAELLRGLGHTVVEAAPKIDGPAFCRAMLIMLSGQVAADVRDAEATLGRKARAADWERETWMSRVLGETFSAGEYQLAVRELMRVSRTLGAFMADHDAWLSPTLGSPPVTIGKFRSQGFKAVAERWVGRLQLGGLVKAAGLLESTAAPVFAFTPYTPLANCGGLPSASLPLHWSAAGLPIGVTLTTRFGDEATLFRLCAQLEDARPWQGRVPPGLG